MRTAVNNAQLPIIACDPRARVLEHPIFQVLGRYSATTVDRVQDRLGNERCLTGLPAVACACGRYLLERRHG